MFHLPPRESTMSPITRINRLCFGLCSTITLPSTSHGCRNPLMVHAVARRNSKLLANSLKCKPMTSFSLHTAQLVKDDACRPRIVEAPPHKFLRAKAIKRTWRDSFPRDHHPLASAASPFCSLGLLAIRHAAMPATPIVAPATTPTVTMPKIGPAPNAPTAAMVVAAVEPATRSAQLRTAHSCTNWRSEPPTLQLPPLHLFFNSCSEHPCFNDSCSCRCRSRGRRLEQLPGNRPRW